MKLSKVLLLTLFLFVIISQSKAQFFQKLADGDWVFGLEWNFVDDNGKPSKNIFGEAGAWNSLPYPSAIRIEKNYNKGFSFVFNGSYNKYRNSKDINNDFDQASTFYALDLGAKFNFVSIYDINAEWFNFRTDVFDIYMSLGAGFTHRAINRVNNTGTANLGLGMNAYVYRNLGINIDATAKFGISNFWNTPSNYTQYSIGVIYKLNNTKRFYGRRHHKKAY